MRVLCCVPKVWWSEWCIWICAKGDEVQLTRCAVHHRIFHPVNEDSYGLYSAFFFCGCLFLLCHRVQEMNRIHVRVTIDINDVIMEHRLL